MKKTKYFSPELMLYSFQPDSDTCDLSILINDGVQDAEDLENELVGEGE